MRRALAGYILAALSLTAGFWLLAPAAGLICAGVCVAALTTITTLDLGGGE